MIAYCEDLIALRGVQSDEARPGVHAGDYPVSRLQPAAVGGLQCRTVLGITQRDSAKRIGVDASTLARCEPVEREPAGDFAERVIRFLKSTETTWAPDTARIA